MRTYYLKSKFRIHGLVLIDCKSSLNNIIDHPHTIYFQQLASGWFVGAKSDSHVQTENNYCVV